MTKFAKAKRILFLVDRTNLGRQTLKEYQAYDPPGSGRKFDKTYIVQQLRSNHVDPDAKVVITTIQRLYAMLQGRDLDEDAEEKSSFETWTTDDGDLHPVTYNPSLPIEHFDFIVTDECHRSIYGVWRQVLDYFDAPPHRPHSHSYCAHPRILQTKPGRGIPAGAVDCRQRQCGL